MYLTGNDRNKQYGDATENHQRIADYWNPYLNHKYGTTLNHLKLSPKDVMVMMALLKIAREDYQHIEDSLVDCVAYLHLANQYEEKHNGA